MKLTERDRIILIILGAVIFIYAYYNFVLAKQFDKVNKLKTQKTQAELKLKQLKTDPAQLVKMESDIKIINSKISDKSSIFFSNVPQEKLIVLVDDLLKKAQLSNSSINFAQPSMGKTQGASADTSKAGAAAKAVQNPLQTIIDEYVKLSGTSIQVNGASAVSTNNQAKGASGNAANNNAQNTVDKVEITLDYSGNYANLMDFLKLIESYDKKIIVSNISIASGKDTGIAGNMILDLYSVPKLTEQEDTVWPFQGPYGKDNPFTGAAVTIAKSDSGNNANLKYDFTMTVKPSSSDLPTVALGKADDTARDTYVYADSNNIENVEMNFTENDGKLYYKYRTSGYFYPQNYSGPGEEFTASGDTINLIVYSTKRNSDADKSGVNIKVSNNTGKKLIVKVLEDDASRPRVNVVGVKGSVEQQ